MISILNVAWGALAASILVIVGFAITRRLVAESLALPLAPVVGWAVYTVLTLPLYRLIGFFTDVSLLVEFAALVLAIRAARDVVDRVLEQSR